MYWFLLHICDIYLFTSCMCMCCIGNRLLSICTCACDIATCSKCPYHFLTASDGPGGAGKDKVSNLMTHAGQLAGHTHSIPEHINLTSAGPLAIDTSRCISYTRDRLGPLGRHKKGNTH